VAGACARRSYSRFRLSWLPCYPKARAPSHALCRENNLVRLGRVVAPMTPTRGTLSGGQVTTTSHHASWRRKCSGTPGGQGSPGDFHPGVPGCYLIFDEGKYVMSFELLTTLEEGQFN